MATTALVLIDAQVNMFEPEPVYDGPAVLARLAALAGRARTAGAPGISAKNPFLQ